MSHHSPKPRSYAPYTSRKMKNLTCPPLSLNPKTKVAGGLGRIPAVGLSGKLGPGIALLEREVGSMMFTHFSEPSYNEEIISYF